MNNQIVYLSGDQKIYIKENEIFLNNFKINSNSLITGQNIISQSGSFSQIETENLLGQNIAGNQIYCNNLDIGGALKVNGTGVLLSGDAPSTQMFNTTINSIGGVIMDFRQDTFDKIGFVGNNYDGFSRVTPPLSKNSSGIVGQYTFNTDYYYICTSPNLWARIPLDYNW